MLVFKVVKWTLGILILVLAVASFFVYNNLEIGTTLRQIIGEVRDVQIDEEGNRVASIVVKDPGTPQSDSGGGGYGQGDVFQYPSSSTEKGDKVACKLETKTYYYPTQKIACEEKNG